MPLTAVATPIGNLGDLSARAIQALTDAEIWIVEDTRVSAKLQAYLSIKRPMRVLNDHTSPARLAEHAQAASEVQVALLTDAGSPGISDPGAELVTLCYQSGVPVDATPGPSAVTLAITLSGFFAQRYVFLGYLPRKPGPASALLEPYADSPLTIAMYESARRYRKTLEVVGATLGSRNYAVCRELTKNNQQVYRGALPQTPAEGEVPERGEMTLVVEGRRRRAQLA